MKTPEKSEQYLRAEEAIKKAFANLDFLSLPFLEQMALIGAFTNATFAMAAKPGCNAELIAVYCKKLLAVAIAEDEKHGKN